MARISLELMEGEKGPTKAKQLHKTADLVVFITDGVANPEIMKAADQESAANTVKILHHAKWWQAQDEPPMQKVATTVIFVII